MAVLQENNQRWIDVELGTRAVAHRLNCKYVPYPLGTKKPFEEPEPSAPTDTYLYMLLPHAIGVFPPHQNFDLVCVATMSAKTFFASAVEKLKIEWDNPPTGDDQNISIFFTGLKDRRKNYGEDLEKRTTFTIHYCRVRHEQGHLLSAPEQISLDGWLFNRDLLARLHDSRHMVKKVRGLDAVADASIGNAPSSAEYRASIVQLMTWAQSCGVLAPRLKLLTSEMLAFCLDQGYAELDIRAAQEDMNRETIAKLLEGCMYKFVMGSNSREGYFSVVTPSGRTLGHSVTGNDVTRMATETIKRAIIRDMTSLSNIALDVPTGRDLFRGEHQMYLKVSTRCWVRRALVPLALDIYTVLLSLEEKLIGLFDDTVVTQIWPFHNSSPVLNEPWVDYIGISEAVVESHINFPEHVRGVLTDKALIELEAGCLNHELFDRDLSFIDIRLKSQQELFGDEVEAKTGLSTDEGMDFDFILGGPDRGARILKPEFNELLKDLFEDMCEEGDLEDFLNHPPSTPAGHIPEIAGQAKKPDIETCKEIEDLVPQVERSAITTGSEDRDDPAPSSNTIQAAAATSSKRFRTAAQVMDRLKHDPRHTAIEYEVGYQDRFTEGLMWKPLDDWQTLLEEEDFIPEHRVWQIRRVADGGNRVIWDRKTKVDGTG